MSENTGKAFDREILKRTLSYVKPYKKAFFGAAALTVSMAFLSPLRPYLIQFAIDKYVALHDHEGLLMITCGMIGLLIVEGIFQFYNDYLSNYLGQSVVRDMRSQTFGHILNLKLAYYDRSAVGTLVTRTVSDIQTISDVFSEGLLTIIGDILKLVVLLIVMFVTDWRLTLICLVSIPILLVATNIFKNAVRKAFHDVRTEVAHLNAFVQEHITGMSIVQIFNREQKEHEKFKAINARHRDANIRSIWHYSVFFPVVEILSSLSLGLLVWWGSKGVLNGEVTLGNLVAFILYINMLFRPIRMLADRFNTLQMGVVCSERVFKVLDTDERIENKGTHTPKEIKGEIEFRNVWFAYKGEDWILKDFNLKVNPGETIAIVGSTGAGKSTIINLVNRFYEFQQGEILVDGIDIRKYELQALRAQISVVLQDVFLFSNSVRNNITFGDTSITPAEIEIAAEKLGADFIKNLPGQYEYDVKERGGMLSVGQRQLISFVRAYVHKPHILILDEATSSIDSETELKIQKATEILTR